MSRRIKSETQITLSENQKDAYSKSSANEGKLIFTDYRGQLCALLISDNRLRGAKFFPRKRSLIGSVHIARVKNVVKNLDAFFVEIGAEKREVCFLSKSDAAYPFLLNRKYDGQLKEGDELLVQVTRDAQKTKQPSVTTLISLANDYFAISIGDSRTGFSNKLDSDQKKALRKLLKENKLGAMSSISDRIPVGLVVRTRAAEFLESSLSIRECFQELSDKWDNLFSIAKHRTCFSCLMEAPVPWQDALSTLAAPEEYQEILTDNREIYEQITHLTGSIPEKKVRYYSEDEQAELPLSKLYGLTGKLETALGRRIWLKSGGYLIIDTTEALTVIDVNSGKYEASKSVQEANFIVNKEAAEEIALQLRLRNMSGIIIVDFINMEKYEDKEALLKYLRALTSKDRQQTTVVDMTPLGLVEITRKKNSKPLAEQVEFQ